MGPGAGGCCAPVLLSLSKRLRNRLGRRVEFATGASAVTYAPRWSVDGRVSKLKSALCVGEFLG